MKLPYLWRIRAKLHRRTLRGKMLAMLLVIVLQGALFSGAITLVGSLYFNSFNAILHDCYQINTLLAAFNAEVSDFEYYILYKDQAAYDRYSEKRVRSDEVFSSIQIPYARSSEQFLLLSATGSALASFRKACGMAVNSVQRDEDYASSYEQALRISGYIQSYIGAAQNTAISEGQVAYQRDAVMLSVLPIGFLVSVALSLICIALWTRWTVRHVVRPINEIIRVAGDVSENIYETKDAAIYDDDEIATLANVVNEMKHSTAHLVDSLNWRREIESKLHDEEMRRVKMESTMDSLRLSLLQSQINPHFLFNTLNIISRMAQIERAPTTEDLIKRLASLFRYNLQNTADIVPVENEIKIVQDYIAIQQIRFGERIQFRVECEDDMKDVRIPVFTLQPLIENAVIHGIYSLELGGKIDVSFRRDQGALTIIVSDTGAGMSAEQLNALLGSANTQRHVSGLGVGNVRARIAAFRPDSSFAIESALGKGTRVTIKIPEEMESND